MNFEGPVLSLQPTKTSTLPTLHERLDQSKVFLHTLSVTGIKSSNCGDIMSSSSDFHLGVATSKPRSASIGEIKSVPSSPEHKTKSLRETKDPPSSLSHSSYGHRPARCISAEPEPYAERFNPSNSLNASGSIKHPLSSRFIRRAPTIDTYDITKEEFEDYTRVNQYKVLDIIGHGSYGIVRKATDDNDEVFAMKILNKKKLLKKVLRGPNRPGSKPRNSPWENIEREIAILKKLDHPNVVRLFEVLNDSQEDDLILVLEYIQNGPVIDKIPMEESFSEDKSREYFIDLILGLEYLHSQNVIHRDIKPQNLLLDNSNRIKIADFGVSEEIEQSEANISRWAGTPAFVAPETLSSSNPFKGQGVDIWAAGITLYCFIYGKVPWSPPSIPELYEMIQENEIPIPKDVPVSTELQDILKKLLTKDPKERITISEIRIHPWILKTDRVIPSEQENIHERISISEEDIQKAIKPYYTPIHILSMIKQMAKRRSLRNPKSYSPHSSPATSPRRTLALLQPSLDAPSRGKRDKFAQSRTPAILIQSETTESS